jgi:hypothetical protein
MKHSLPGDCNYPARKKLTMVVLDVLTGDLIEEALHRSERRSIEWDRDLEMASVIHLSTEGRA